MGKKWFNSERVVPIAAFIFLLIAVIVGIAYNGDEDSILEYIPHNPDYVLTSFIIPIVHAIACSWCFFLIFKPSVKGECGIMLIESTLTILTGTELLGIFLFYGAVCLYQIDTADQPKSDKVVKYMLIGHALLILSTFLRGWKAFLMDFGCSLFYFAFFLWIYYLLRSKFSYFLPQSVTNSSVIKEAPGEVVHLKDYGLTERQIKITKDYITNNPSYKELAEKHITSLSSIKKDFSIIFQKLGVKNIQELNFLLVQYQIEA